MARSLEQILKELEPAYAGSRRTAQTQIEALPGQFEAQKAGVDARLQEANEGILGAARRRGLGFSGIPVAEQAQYAASEYAPAVARLEGEQLSSRLSLEEMLNQLGREQRTQAIGIRDSEQARALEQRQLAIKRRELEESARQFNEQLAFDREQARTSGSGSSSAGVGAYLGGGAGQSQALPQMQRRGGGGFNFQNASGNAISAAKYAQLTGQSLGSVLQAMGQQGDTYAAQLYNQLKNDPSYKTGDKQYLERIKRAYSPIFWGT